MAEWYEDALEASGFAITDPCDAFTSPLRFESHGWTGGIGIFDQGTQTSANIALERPLG